MWIEFLEDDDRRVRRVKGGITTGVVRYKRGMVENVPRVYGEAVIAAGKAKATTSPHEEPANATPASSGSSDGAAVATRSRRRRGG